MKSQDHFPTVESGFFSGKISRTIVESHGGRLAATANDERGATFHFTLPTEGSESSSLAS
jgi:K+-sensing histidine kinase KdpD